MKRRLLSIACALLIAACSTKDSEPMTAQEIAGRVVLESYELDLTFGYRLRGIYIVGDGTVWSFDYDGPPFYPENLKLGELTARDMLTRHRNAKQIGTVDRAGLLDIAQLIRPAAAGKIVRAVPNHEGSSRIDVAYEPTSTGKYKEVLLGGSGDRTATNSAPEAAMLIDYLREVQQSVGWSW